MKRIIMLAMVFLMLVVSISGCFVPWHDGRDGRDGRDRGHDRDKGRGHDRGPDRNDNRH